MSVKLRSATVGLLRVFALLLFTSSNGWAAQYRLDVITGPDTIGSDAVAINDANQVAINIDWGPGVWIDGQVTLLDRGTAYSSQALSINPQGIVTGYSLRTAASGMAEPVIWVNGQRQELSTYTPYGVSGAAAGMNAEGSIILTSRPYSSLLTPPNQITYIPPNATTLGGGTIAAAINSSGQIVGSATLINTSRATLWNNQGTEAIDLGVLNENMYPEARSFATAINDHGVVAGYSDTYQFNVNDNQRYKRAFKWQNGQMTELPSLPSNITNRVFSSYAYGINESNVIVGMSSRYNDYLSIATMWDENGQIVNLNTLLSQEDIDAGWVLTQATDINNAGVIVGSAFNNQTRLTSAFMLTPVPEANTLAMMLLGLAGVATAQRRKCLLQGAWA